MSKILVFLVVLIASFKASASDIFFKYSKNLYHFNTALDKNVVNDLSDDDFISLLNHSKVSVVKVDSHGKLFIIGLNEQIGTEVTDQVGSWTEVTDQVGSWTELTDGVGAWTELK